MAKCFNFAAKADKRIEVFKRTGVADGAGGEVLTTVLVGTFWANIQPMSMREQYLNEQIQSKVTDKVVIRYQASLKDTRVTASYYMKFDDRYYDIKGVKNLDTDMKSEGKAYQSLKVVENDTITGGV